MRLRCARRVLLLVALGAACWPVASAGAAPRADTDLWVRSATARFDAGLVDLRLVASNHGERGSRPAASSVSWRPVRSVRSVVLRRFQLPPVAGRGRRAVRLRVTLPQGARGAYLVTVCVNARAQVRERNLRNNCRRAGQVTVPEPRAPLTPAPAPELPSPLVPGVPAPPPPVPDTTPPQTTINGAPAAIAGQSVATFWFSAGARSTFECRLDDGPWEFCSPPRQYTSLAAGPHRFEVRAVDTAGNVDPTPAEHAWTVDLTRPQTMIASGPSGLVASAEATFEVGSDDPAASFECRLDGGSWASCASPVALSGLADGAHTFDVRAIDLAANQDTTPASRTWTVDTTAPGTVISAGPSGEVPPGDVAFSFGSDDAGATFECRVDDAPFAPCVSPQPVLAPAPGPHTFEVRAVDPAGNADPSPAAGAWTTLAPG